MLPSELLDFQALGPQQRPISALSVVFTILFRLILRGVKMGTLGDMSGVIPQLPSNTRSSSAASGIAGPQR